MVAARCDYKEAISLHQKILPDPKKEDPQPKRLRASMSHRFPLGMDFCEADIELISRLCLHAVQHDYWSILNINF